MAPLAGASWQTNQRSAGVDAARSSPRKPLPSWKPAQGGCNVSQDRPPSVVRARVGGTGLGLCDESVLVRVYATEALGATKPSTSCPAVGGWVASAAQWAPVSAE